MKKAFAILLLLVFILPFSTVTKACDAIEVGKSADSESTLTYLMCGYDDAGFNTDSIILARYSFSDNEICFLQIPRDTYYSEAPYGKINSLFPSSLSEGMTKQEGMERLRNSISAALGIKIDAYIGYTMQTFVNLIDAIGGVDITLTSPFEVKDSDGENILSLPAGESHLNGNDALLFVRSRNAYKAGDLGRIDAQKRFLSAFMQKVKNDITISNVIRICIQAGNGWTVDAKIKDLFYILLKNKGRISNIGTIYVNLPGLQTEDKTGIWYYVASKPLTDSLLNNLGFLRTGPFDVQGRLYKPDEQSFSDIYNSTDLRVKIYGDSDLIEP